MSLIDVEIDKASARRVAKDMDATASQIARANTRAVRKTVKWAANQSASQIARQNKIPVGVLTGAAAARRYRQNFTGPVAPGDAGLRAGAAAAKRRGRRIFERMPQRGSGYGSVWVGTQPVKAAAVGTLRQTRRGTRAGRHVFPGSFLATLRSGHRASFHRASTLIRKSPGAWGDNLPIVEDVVELEGATQVAAGVQRRAPARLLELLRQEVNYEINVRGRR